jgi:hypothetical protein
MPDTAPGSQLEPQPIEQPEAIADAVEEANATTTELAVTAGEATAAIAGMTEETAVAIVETTTVAGEPTTTSAEATAGEAGDTIIEASAVAEGTAAAPEMVVATEEKLTAGEVALVTAETTSEEPVPQAAQREGPSLGERLRATFAPLRERLGSGAWAYGVYALIGVLVIIALLLPPVSLLERLGITGYTTVSAQDNGITHPDGLTLSVDPATFTGKLRVRLDSLPRADFLGFAHSSLRGAVEALPSYFQVKSPFYRIRARGKPEQPVMIDVLIPNDAEPWETLDLYTWTGETWEWVGGELHTETAEHEFIRAQVTDIPANVVVVQAGPLTQTVSTCLGAGDNLALAAGLTDEINPTGLFLGIDGGFVGDPASLLQPVAGDPYAVLPTLRNWAPGATVNHGLLADVLTIPDIQETHIANIVQLCTGRGFAGVDIDYRGVLPAERDTYSSFIAALADALHAQGLRLSVVVEPPISTAGGWDTGGYDWVSLGAAADALKVPFPADPAAYVEGGEAQRLLAWAAGQIPRYKTRMLLSSLSAEQAGTQISYISLEQALAPFGNATALSDVSQVLPNSQVQFALTGQVLSITPQEAAGTYRLEYTGGDGANHTIWLGTSDSLAAKIAWAQRYHLGGIAVDDVLAPGNASGIVDVVAAYRNNGSTPTGQGIDVVWTVADATTTIAQTAAPLNNPVYAWIATVTGTYTVNTTIAGFTHGSIAVTVAEPPPVQSAAAITQPSSMQTTGESAAICLNSTYAADVTIPDNMQLDNGVEFTKTWRIRNNGTCAWPADTVLAFSSGTQMDAPASVAVGAVQPGAEVEVSAKMKSPANAGQYTAMWRTQTADGFFGMEVSVVILAGEVAAPAAVVVAPVSGGGFELGGHIRDQAFPYASQMHYAGMNWAKVQVHYGDDASGIVAAAHAQGFKIQLSALGSPTLVTQPGFEQNFATWVASLARSGADAIEVWNEPNIDREWQIGYINPQAYANLLCVSYNAIKAANSGTAVISAAPAPTGWFGGCSPNGCDDQPWMEGLFNAGAANCMDYIGAHHNAGATSPSATTGHPADAGDHHHSWYFLPQTQLYYNIFRGTRKIFYTEMGYASQEGLPTFSDAFAWARGINNAQQAAWLAEAVGLGVNTGMVRCIIVWNIDFTRYGDDPQDGYGIIRPGGSCPACESLHNVMGTR